MADVFVSYASEDRDRAAKLAGAVSALGWSVWWDRRIITGQAFDQAIEHELETAKSVVVLWSKHSIASEWVKNEAAVASERGVLVPAIIDTVKLPLEFRRKQTADLTDWKGEPSHSGFQALCEGVATTIGGAPPDQPIPRHEQKLRRSPRWAMAAIAAIAVAVGLGVYLMGPWRTTTRTPIPQSDRSPTSTPSESKKALAAAGPADLVVGTYFGEVIADSKGHGRKNVTVTVTKLDGSTVRVTSDYPRLGNVDLPLSQNGNVVFSGGSGGSFLAYLDRNPPTLSFDPPGVAYRGIKQK